MLELFKTYSIDEIVMFILLLALAIKGIVDLYDWFKKRFREPIEEEMTHEEQKQEIIDRLNTHEGNILECKECLNKILDTINILVDSDKDDIKSWITEKHHYFCYELKYIDDYSLQCVEARYKHYKDEKGNSFIDKFMEDIRALPIVSVTNQKK